MAIRMAMINAEANQEGGESNRLTPPLDVIRDDGLLVTMWLRKSTSHLDVDVFVDDGGSYKRHNHMPLIFVRNAYDNSISDFIPISISCEPVVLDADMVINISSKTILAVMDFIKINAGLLTAMADDKISHAEFIAALQQVS